MTDHTSPLIVVAGATGYLGGCTVRALHQAGFRVRALARNPKRLAAVADCCDEVFVGEATRIETLEGLCDDAFAVFSSIGIRSLARRPTLWDVDRDANLNLMRCAEQAGVSRFVFTSIQGAPIYRKEIKVMEAREQVVDALAASSMTSTIIRPTGLFNDMAEFFGMAQKGRLWLCGDGQARVNPIHGEDVGEWVAAALQQATPPTEADLGGPETFTLNEIGALAFEVLGRSPKVSHVPLWVLSACAGLTGWWHPNLATLLRGFRHVCARGAVAEATGHRTLRAEFERLRAA